MKRFILFDYILLFTQNQCQCLQFYFHMRNYPFVTNRFHLRKRFACLALRPTPEVSQLLEKMPNKTTWQNLKPGDL